MAKKPSKSAKSKNDNYEDMEEREGHEQEGGAEKSSETDMEEAREAQDAGDAGDPFEQMMREASKNARYTVAFIPNQGTVSKNDPTRISPDETENMPKVRGKGK